MNTDIETTPVQNETPAAALDPADIEDSEWKARLVKQIEEMNASEKTDTESQHEAPTVQIRTQTTSSRLEELVGQFQSFAKKSAEYHLQLAETVYIAKEELNPAELQAFCDRVGLKRDSSEFRKWNKIGEKASRFEKFVDRLPQSRETLYQLAKLQPDQFDKVTKDNRFGPAMTAAEVKEIVPGRGRGTPNKKPACKIYFDDLDTPGKRKAHAKIIELSHECGFTCDFSAEVKEELADFEYDGDA